MQQDEHPQPLPGRPPAMHLDRVSGVFVVRRPDAFRPVEVEPMTKTYHDPDAPLDALSLHSVNPADDYNETGWIVALRVPDDDTLRAVLERWGPK